MKVVKLLLVLCAFGWFGCSSSETKDGGSNNNNTGLQNCGNGQLDPGERCDSAIAAGQPGACPTACSTDACAPETLLGSAATCSASCEPTEATCTNGDGCCGPGCDSSNDDDCSNTCGNGIVEEPETCDGDCAPCESGNACTVSTSTGSADTCSLVCRVDQITTCEDDDGCCPSSCSSNNDNDCNCTPTINCEDRGWECGGVDDNGCGQPVNCGTCSGDDVCVNRACVDSLGIGQTCTSDSDCPGEGVCIESATSGFPGGYCTKSCNLDSECGPYHCHGESNTPGVCAQTCSSNSECRTGYACYDRDNDGNNECWPIGSGNSPLGGPCDLISDCGLGEGAVCQIGAHFTDGYCTKQCQLDRDCPNGSCVESACFDNCNSDDDCRNGYLCYDLGNTGTSKCAPAGTGNGAVGSSCTNVGECGGGQHAACADVFPGGYCTIFCGDFAAQGCPASSVCVAVGDEACLASCQSNLDCRSGYECVDADFDGHCLPMSN